MKIQDIVAKIQVCSYEELSSNEKLLVEEAKKASLRSYSPYSQFKVGAALLLQNGEIVSGNNQENAAFPSGLCAERTALFYANSKYPDSAVIAIAVAAYTDGNYLNHPITPCGACRQVILEAQNRYKQPIQLILYGEKEIYRIEKITDLLPLSFDHYFSSSETD